MTCPSCQQPTAFVAGKCMKCGHVIPNLRRAAQDAASSTNESGLSDSTGQKRKAQAISVSQHMEKSKRAYHVAERERADAKKKNEAQIAAWLAPAGFVMLMLCRVFSNTRDDGTKAMVVFAMIVVVVGALIAVGLANKTETDVSMDQTADKPVQPENRLAQTVTPTEISQSGDPDPVPANIQQIASLPANPPLIGAPTTLQARAPNHAGRIIFLGLLAWIIGIVGIMAFSQGKENLKKIESGEMTADGKGLIIFGMCSGVLGLLVNVSVIIARCSSGAL